MALTWNNRLDYEARKLIDAEIGKMVSDLSEGTLKSFDDYKHFTGQIAGMKRALECLSEAVSICDGKSRDEG